MNKIVFCIIIIFSFTSCSLFQKKKEIDLVVEKTKMIDADKAFSEMSVEKGMKNAFMEYIDSNGVLLRPNQMPVVGADAIDYLLQINDSAYTLRWEPKHGAIAQSGELGYTYGLYELKLSTKDSVIYGTYVSIWKKQLNGKWKFVLDSGNEGVGKEEQE